MVGGGGATGVELAGELAEVLPEVARGHGLAPDRPKVMLVEAGPTILAGSSPALVDRAVGILQRLGVEVRTHARIAEATGEGFKLADGELVHGGAFVWAGGVKAPALVAGSGLPVGHNGRIKLGARTGASAGLCLHGDLLDGERLAATGTGDLGGSVLAAAVVAQPHRWPVLPGGPAVTPGHQRGQHRH